MRDFDRPGRSAVFATNGVCATSHPLAAGAAVDILKAGGNAVDAALAAAAVLGVAEPHMCALGGDCFALLKPAGSETVRALNGSGRAPAGASAAALRAAGHATVPESAPAAVTIPGAVDAFCALSAEHGTLALDQVFAAAIRYAEDGIPVAPRVARDWALQSDHLQGRARDLHLPGGKPPKPGHVFHAPGQAEVLRRIARDGRAAFYEGEVAADVIDTLQGLGGWHSLDDMAATACTWGDPIASGYNGFDLLEHAPNGQGATAMLILNILKHFDLASMDPLGPERAHIEAEATKLGYDARNRIIADPDHCARLDHMLAPETAAALAALIDPARAMADPAPLSEAVHRDTVYLTVVDRDRMAVSFIYSIYHPFGSGIASEKFGILMQSRGSGFTLAEGHPNEMGPGKRPMHTIIPAMLCHEGRLVMPFGVMGGPYQACGHARFVSNLLDYGMDPQAAIDAPRAFPEDGVLNIEAPYPEATSAALAELGHNVQRAPDPIGGAQAIWMHDSGVLEAASDPRKDGCAIGY